MAYVLFTDLVGYSKLPMDQGAQLVEQLTKVVEGTKAFRRAKETDQLILLPTGDGMALVFFNDPMAAVKCAVAVSRAIGEQPTLKLRMGVHSGPVFRTVDINEARNVAGGGINVAQRVMDCGDEGHILVSQSIADVLKQLSDWREYVHDIGVQEVKHGEQIHIFNLYGSEFGNPERPRKSPPKSAPTVETGSDRRVKRVLVVAGAVATVVVAGALSWNSLFCRVMPDLPGCAVTPGLSTERMLHYWITVQRYRDGRPYREPFRLAREVVFEADYLFFVHLSSPQDGYLYIINEGPELIEGLPSYNLLFPNSVMNNGEPFLEAGRRIQIPESAGFELDEEEGTEKLWFVWAAERVPELEEIKGLANPADQGVIRDPEQKRAILEFLSRQSSNKPKVESLEEEKQTLVTARGSVLVHLVPLEHH